MECSITLLTVKLFYCSNMQSGHSHRFHAVAYFFIRI